MRKHKIRGSISFLFAALLFCTSGTAKEVSVSVQEMMDWSERQFADAASLPLSFLYDGESSDTWLSACRIDVKTKQDKQGRIGEIRTYTDPQRKIEVRCEIVRYTDYPAVEWTVYVKNNGKTNTGIFENLMALDLPFTVGSGETVYLNYNVGGASGIDGDGAREFQPLREKLDVGRSKELGAFWAGFPTAQNLPFFNIERKEGAEGVIAAVGWPARWKASFARTADTTLTAQVGQIHTRFYLEPGEEVRTPLVVLMFWQGNREEAQNQWRRWMYDHNLPRPGGELPEPILEAASSSFFAEMFHATDKDQIEFIDRYLEEGIQLDYWWMDAGWYPNKGGSWQDLLGTWYPDPKRYPNGLRAISDHAHSKGVKTLLWFEPERVTEGSWIYEHHPEWTLGTGPTRFFNYGNPEALEWMTDHVDSLLKSEDIDLYRQDFAVMSASFWDEADRQQPDRQGITEIKHVIGYLKYMDELQRRHPEMLIDICAAGGKRLELENLRRAVPLWRSDYAFEPRGVQGQTYGLSEWIPFTGAGVNRITAYDFRSNMSPSIVLNLDARIKDADYPLLRELLAQWEEIRDDYRGDFYPLTGYSLQNDVWIGWMFFRPETGTGFIQMFNRAESIYDSGVCRLKGIDREKSYRITDMDSGRSEMYEGARLLDEGLRLNFTQAPEAKLLRIEPCEE